MKRENKDLTLLELAALDYAKEVRSNDLDFLSLRQKELNLFIEAVNFYSNYRNQKE